jgi:hypothetical protein
VFVESHYKVNTIAQSVCKCFYALRLNINSINKFSISSFAPCSCCHELGQHCRYESDTGARAAIARVCTTSVPIKAFMEIEMVISYFAIS